MTKRGFSLLEIILAFTIFSLLLIVLVSFEVSIFRQDAFYQGSLAANQSVRSALRQMTAELRAAGFSDGGAYPIAAASSTGLTFYSDLDKDSLREQVRYFLEGDELKRGVTESSGVPPVYNLAGEKLNLLVPDLTDSNQIIFSYFDKNYAGTSTPLSFPVYLPAVRLVKISLKVQTGPVQSPVFTTYATKIMIRSLKDNL
jgi:type II secretory pathway component PulJ